MEIKRRRETLSSEGGRMDIPLVEGSRASPVRPSDVSGTKMKTLDYLLQRFERNAGRIFIYWLLVKSVILGKIIW
jgi:hypothetical protein